MKIHTLTISQNQKNSSQKIIYTHQLKTVDKYSINEIACWIGKTIVVNVITKGMIYKLGFRLTSHIDFAISYNGISTLFTIRKTKNIHDGLIKTSEGWFTVIDVQTNEKVALTTGLFDRPWPDDLFKEMISKEYSKRKTPEIPTPIGGAVKKK